ncbi:MAG: AbrB family transcriptional regulator [Sphingopyxis sp.]
MTKEWKAKAFKSGNSIALRLPKALGFEDGEEVIIAAHRNGGFSMWKTADGLNILMSLYGSMSPGFMKHGRGDIEQDERDWSHGSTKNAA